MSNYKIDIDNGEVTMVDLSSGCTLKWMQGNGSTLRTVSAGTLSAEEYLERSQEMTEYAYENKLLTESGQTAMDRQTARERIGQLVREARKEAGLTVRELGDKAGIAHSHIVRIEAGRYNVSVDTLDKLGKVLGFKLEFVKD